MPLDQLDILFNLQKFFIVHKLCAAGTEIGVTDNLVNADEQFGFIPLEVVVSELQHFSVLAA